MSFPAGLGCFFWKSGYLEFTGGNLKSMSDCRGQSLENSLSYAVSVVRFSLRQMELSVIYLYLHVLVFTGNRKDYISGRFTKTLNYKARKNQGGDDNEN